MVAWYCEDDATNSYGWTALTARANSTAYSVGNIRKQDGSVTVGNERAYICLSAGTSGASSPTWTYTKGASVTDGDVVWREVTGQAAVNGDTTAANTPMWAAGTNFGLTSPITRNSANTHYFAVGVDAGSSGASEPTWNTATGATTIDNGITWVCIGAVGDFSGYAAPHARIATPMGTGFMAAGDTLYVSDRHAETQSSAISAGSTNGTFVAPLNVVCVNHSNVPPTTLATSATVTTSGASSYIAFQDEITFYGISFVSSYTSTTQFQIDCDLVNCNFSIAANGVCGFSGANVDNMTVTFGSSGSHIRLTNDTYSLRILSKISNLTLAGTAPDTVFKGASSSSGVSNWIISDSDLSLCTGILLDVSSIKKASVEFRNCKLGSDVTLVSGSVDPTVDFIRFVNCSSSNINYSYALHRPQGTAEHETTTVRTGGASDGATPISLNITTKSSAHFGRPFVSDPIAIWNETTGSSLTATVEIAGSSSLNNDDIWMEIEYLGSSTACTGSVVSNRRGLLASAAAVTSSTASWGGSPTYTQKLQCAFTPQKAGPVVARVYVGKASATIYVDPMITIT